MNIISIVSSKDQRVFKKIKVRLYRSRYLKKKKKKHLMLHLNIEKNIYVSNITTTVVVFIDTIVTLYVI